MTRRNGISMNTIAGGAFLLILSAMVAAGNGQAKGGIVLSDETPLRGTVHDDIAFLHEQGKGQVSIRNWRTGAESWRIRFASTPAEMKVSGATAMAMVWEKGHALSMHRFDLRTGDHSRTDVNAPFRPLDARLVDTGKVLLFGKDRLVLHDWRAGRDLASFPLDGEPIVFSDAELARDTIRVIIFTKKHKLRLVSIPLSGGNPGLLFHPPLEQAGSILPGYSFGDHLRFKEGKLFWLQQGSKGALRMGAISAGRYFFSDIGSSKLASRPFGFANGQVALLEEPTRELKFIGPWK